MSAGRRFTEPLREPSALVLLGGNAVLLLIGFARLFFVVDGWASAFGSRAVAAFPVFVGPLSLGLPILAAVLATHVEPMVGRYRLVMVAACAQYGVSALFGLVTFLAAFAEELPAARVTVEGLLVRGVWLGFLGLGAIVLMRLYVGLFPLAGTGGPGYGRRTYPARPAPAYDGPTLDTGWPVVSARPGVPAPPVSPEAGDADAGEPGGGALGAQDPKVQRPSPREPSPREPAYDPAEPPTGWIEP